MRLHPVIYFPIILALCLYGRISGHYFEAGIIALIWTAWFLAGILLLED